MGEIKNRWEIISEKLKEIPPMSPEELRERKEAEYTPIGRTLAEKYLRHGYGKLLKEEVNKYQEKDVVIKAALSRLVEAIELTNREITEKAVEGLLTIKGDERVREINEKIRTLCGEHQQAKQQRYEREKEGIQRWGRELLHQLRISGDAVGEINAEASEAWREVSNELYLQFEERLSQLKQELLKFMGYE